ncbi:MAG: hypothetical protein H7338_12365 [Candidatus Sericytochromatia bacterium]|nr:hypothetical protein [Candidatus Sericytochromatia bacterium]
MNFGRMAAVVAKALADVIAVPEVPTTSQSADRSAWVAGLVVLAGIGLGLSYRAPA